MAIHLNDWSRPGVERRLERIGVFGTGQRGRFKKPSRASIDEFVFFVGIRVFRGEVTVKHLSRRRWKFLFLPNADFADYQIVTHAVPTISCGTQPAPNRFFGRGPAIAGEEQNVGRVPTTLKRCRSQFCGTCVVAFAASSKPEPKA